MAQYLLLDKDRKAVNCMDWDGTTEFIMPEGATSFVKYDGPFVLGWTWNGAELFDPSLLEQPPDEPQTE